jgi:perosamine synthetase
MRKRLSRRRFLSATGAGVATARLAVPAANPAKANAFTHLGDDKLAVLGGQPVRKGAFTAWPIIADNDEQELLTVLRSKRWNRLGGSAVERFEKLWAERLGARHCVATSSGTSALVCSINALDIGPGDEVIMPVYTFVATVNPVLLHHALPVFVDTDRETSQLDVQKLEAAITKRTRAIIPVHLGGAAANLDVILPLAKKYGVPVLEDACQSHLAEWRGQKVGTLGTLGCFSFQASKHLNSGEGGAVVTNKTSLAEIITSYHNQGRAKPDTGFQYERNGDNRRLTEFQGALLLAQLARLEAQARTREQNAAYLSKLLNENPGLTPARMYEGCTRNAYHLFMMRYDAAHFSGLKREQFLKALRAEGIPCSSGYAPLNKEPFLKNTFASRAYRYIYKPQELAALTERNRCPENDKLCEEAVWFTQTMLLGGKEDMEQIAAAVRKIQKQAGLLAKA